MLRVAMVALALSLGAGSASAQTMRAFTTFRQLHGETRLQAHLDYRAGGLRVAPGRATELYRMDASYDEDRYLPISDFNAARGVVSLGLRPAGEGGLRVISKRQLRQDANVAFSPAVDLQAGASQAVIRFSQPNRSRCRAAEITAGAAEVTMLGLGNSRCDRIDFEGGVGKVTLDFDGTWTSSSQATVKMAMGELTLRLPRRVGVRLTLDRFLSTFDPAGLVPTGNGFQSAGYDRAERRLDIAVTTAVGGVKVEWVDEKKREE